MIPPFHFHFQKRKIDVSRVTLQRRMEDEKQTLSAEIEDLKNDAAGLQLHYNQARLRHLRMELNKLLREPING